MKKLTIFAVIALLGFSSQAYASGVNHKKHNKYHKQYKHKKHHNHHNHRDSVKNINKLTQKYNPTVNVNNTVKNVNANRNVSKSNSVSNSVSKSYATGGNSNSYSRGGNSKSNSVAKGGQGGSAVSEGSVSSNVNDVSVDASSHYESSKIPVSSANAPALTSSEDTCMGSSSLGAQATGFGLSLGSTWEDDDCVRRKDARFLHNMGKASLALTLLCQSESVREAVLKSGTLEEKALCQADITDKTATTTERRSATYNE